MARPQGITDEAIAAKVASLAGDLHRTPTYREMRELGGIQASNRRLKPFLDEHKATCPPEGVADMTVEHAEVPQSVSDAAYALWRAALVEAEAVLSVERDKLARELTEARHDIARLEAEALATTEAAEKAAARSQAQAAQAMQELAELRMRVEELTISKDAAIQARDRARAEADGLREDMKAMTERAVTAEKDAAVLRALYDQVTGRKPDSMQSA